MWLIYEEQKDGEAMGPDLAISSSDLVLVVRLCSPALRPQ
jgi:hypothetical protein